MFHVKQCAKGGSGVATAKKKKKPGKPGGLRRAALRALLLLIGALLVAMAVQGNVVRLRCVELPLRDLPEAFDGVKIVFVSDIHLTALNPLAKVNAVMRELEKIQPDLLLLGGDYTGNDVIGRLVSEGRGELFGAKQSETRGLFFLSLADFPAPLGKFAVAGDMDNLLERSATMALEDAASLGGVTLLRDSSVRVTKGGQSIALVGVDDWRTGVQNTRTPARGMRSNDCVIVISHSPEAIPQLAAQPGEDGGRWIDAALTGHTLGGQIRVGGYEVFSPLAGDERYGAGWHMENGVKRLVSEGLCGGFLPLRWGTGAEVHVITLRRQTGE